MTSASSIADDIRDIRGPISIPYTWLWAVYVAVGIALAIAAYAAFMTWRKYRRKAARAQLPHEIALDALERARALMTADHAREYSFAVSELTRAYIEARFQERAARRTTEEFLYNLLARAGSPLTAYRERLEDFLRHCDLAKFARWQLSIPDMESMHESAHAFILETQPRPAARPGVAPGHQSPPPAAAAVHA